MSAGGDAGGGGSAAANGGASDELVSRAIKDLIDSIPGAEDQAPPLETPATAQPWAETASPSAKSKRPLETILAEYTERVAASPDARAGVPDERHPGEAFYDRFGRPAHAGEGRRRRRRRVSARKRRGGGGGGGGGSGGGGGRQRSG